MSHLLIHGICCNGYCWAQGVLVLQDERRRSRLERLRERFSCDYQVRDVDKDERFVTSTRPEHMHDRTFFLGEIFWVGRLGWHGCGGFGANGSRDHHPGAVCRKQVRGCKPVDMVPGSTKLREQLENGAEAHIFSPAGKIKWDGEDRGGPETQFFVLDYVRPVPRLYIGRKLGRLQHKDQMRLQNALAATAAETVQPGEPEE